MGPVYVKNYRHEVKRYVCVFTCMSVRAIHLEKIEMLDTDSFVNALSRSTARRGPVVALYSENGTNCVGAENELSRAYASILNDMALLRFATHNNFTWHFNPPHASHNRRSLGENDPSCTQRVARCLCRSAPLGRVIREASHGN